jgi:hypothetical protein
MRVSLIRFNASLQVSPNYAPAKSSFGWIQMLTSNWEQGSRNRTKCFGTFSAAYRYLNKLSIGGYLSDEDYHVAWCLLLDLESSVEKMDVEPLSVLLAYENDVVEKLTTQTRANILGILPV